MHNPDDLLTPTEAAELRGVHVKSVYRAIDKDLLKAERRGKRILLIRYEDLMKWRAESGQPRKKPTE